MPTAANASVVIVVEDDAPLLKSLEWALQLEGHEVRGFGDALSVLKLEDLPERGCLVLDYRLPDLDGLELLRRLRARGVLLPAVLITTPGPRVAREAQAAGVDLIEKPLLPGILLQRVRELTT